jgi:C1A family cysteine protease
MKFSTLASLLSVTATVSARFTRHHELTDSYSFLDYLRESGKVYSTEEMKVRRSIFDQNLQKIKAHNADKTQTWKMGVNKFTDMREEELKYWKGGNKHSLRRNQKLSTKHSEIDLKSLPASIDWRDSDVITAVKDQVCSALCSSVLGLTSPLPGPLRQLLGSRCC